MDGPFEPSSQEKKLAGESNKGDKFSKTELTFNIQIYQVSLNNFSFLTLVRCPIS